MRNGERTNAGIMRRSAVLGTPVIIGILVFIGSIFASGSPAGGGPANGSLVTEDIPYTEIAGFDKVLTSLDIYRPGEGTGYPVIIFIHGGAWKMGDKKYHRDIGDFFAGNGYVTVNVNYRLSPGVIHPSHMQDVAAAVAWVTRNIDEYGGDPSRIFIMGHSAGAHLSALVATDGRYLAAYGLDPGMLAGVIPLDGAVLDIPELMRGHERAYGRMYRTAFGDDPNNWADGSPINHVGSGKSIPPFPMIWAGLRDKARPQTQRFADLLEDAGVTVQTYHARDKTHASILTDIGKPGDETTEKILIFLKRLDVGKTPLTASVYR
jgi:arylformamidase